MKQSERITQNIKFETFTVDYTGFQNFKVKFDAQFASARERLASLGLENFNSTKQKKLWLESLGCDCTRGTGKIVYTDPVNIASHPAEMEALAEVQRLETLRRKINGFEKNLIFN